VEGKPISRARKVQGTKEVASENAGETMGLITKVAQTGLEQSQPSPGITQIPAQGGARGGAVRDADLQAVVDAWPTLPADSRQAIVGIVRGGLNRRS
jgi:hypothetical protein